VSFDKIHSRLGFVCERTLEQGIRELADMVRRSEVNDFSTEMFNNRAMVHLYAQSAAASQSSISRLEHLVKAQ
jgi:acetolactate synthase small subunit